MEHTDFRRKWRSTEKERQCNIRNTIPQDTSTFILQKLRYAQNTSALQVFVTFSYKPQL